MEQLTSKLLKRDKAHLHRDFLENEESYWKVRETLLQHYRGKWVAVQAGEVVAHADDVFDILDWAEKARSHPYIARVGFEDRQFVIRRVLPSESVWKSTEACRRLCYA